MSKNVIKDEKRIFDNYFKVDEGTVVRLHENGSTQILSRMKVTRPDAVAVLIINEDTDKVILVKQFRYPIAHRESENILEIVAGKIDANETPLMAVKREVMEEIGYNISDENLSKPRQIYASPGYSTEKLYVYIARVNNSMKINDGGGVEAEDEELDIVEMNTAQFMAYCQDGIITDSKSVVSSYMLLVESINNLLNSGYAISKK